MINVAQIKKRGEETFEEIRGYDNLNIQPSCFVFIWFDTNKSHIVPIDLVQFIDTSQEED